jgi:hypothetical protein
MSGAKQKRKRKEDREIGKGTLERLGFLVVKQ